MLTNNKSSEFDSLFLSGNGACGYKYYSESTTLDQEEAVSLDTRRGGLLVCVSSDGSYTETKTTSTTPEDHIVKEDQDLPTLSPTAPLINPNYPV
jgi:hypothetical protein